jgi:dTDP-4-dehydrorhamnose reductase
MQIKNKKILVLGHRGMAGHIIHTYLNKKGYVVISADKLIGLKFNVLNQLAVLEEKLESNPVDYIINCVGLLIKKSEENPGDAIKINSLFPHQLVKIADGIMAQVIHLSTDCYMDDSIYGRTKKTGEIDFPNHLTVRTSFVGPELEKTGAGLFEWFMRQKGEVHGYTNVLWDGITTLELAKFIDWYIKKEHKLSGIKNLRSSKPISKYELLNLIKKRYQKKIKINKFGGIHVNKTEKNDFLNYKIPEYEQMIKELFEFQK